jgi:hypothetical protein
MSKQKGENPRKYSEQDDPDPKNIPRANDDTKNNRPPSKSHQEGIEEIDENHETNESPPNICYFARVILFLFFGKSVKCNSGSAWFLSRTAWNRNFSMIYGIINNTTASGMEYK